MKNQNKEFQKKHLDNSMSNNRYCFCNNFIAENKKCLICESLENGIDYQKVNNYAPSKYRIVITGTNGKTTLTNLIGNVLNIVFSDKAGFASSSGIYSEGKKIFSFEHRASEHYVYLLNQKENDFIVSEQPDAGLAKYGLPIDHDFGIINNITREHLERHWIRSGMDDYYALKSLVARMSVEGCITSVDNFWTRQLIDDYYNNFFLFGLNKNQVKKYLKKNFQVTTVENGEFVILDGKKRVSAGMVTDYLITLNGILKYNIQNLLPVISLFYNSKKFKSQFSELIAALKQISPSFELSPARFNVLDYQGKLVVFDYAHNIDGYAKSLSALLDLKKITGKKHIYALTAIANDRNEEGVRSIGGVLSNYLDNVYVREIKDNKNTLTLSKILKNNGAGGDIWASGYTGFIEKMSNYNSLVYLTISGLGNIKDLEDVIKDLGLKNINNKTLETV